MSKLYCANHKNGLSRKAKTLIGQTVQVCIVMQGLFNVIGKQHSNVHTEII